MNKATLIRMTAMVLGAGLVTYWIMSVVGCGQATGDVSMDDLKNNVKQSSEIKKMNPGTGGNSN